MLSWCNGKIHPRKWCLSDAAQQQDAVSAFVLTDPTTAFSRISERTEEEQEIKLLFCHPNTDLESHPNILWEACCVPQGGCEVPLFESLKYVQAAGCVFAGELNLQKTVMEYY